MKSQLPLIRCVAAGVWLTCASAAAQTPVPPAASAEERALAEESVIPATLEADAALERARSLYQEGRFDRCRQAYQEVFDQLERTGWGDVSHERAEQARVLFASCLLAIGERELAEAQIRGALEANPLMPSPDPVEFPSQVRDLFFTVKADFLDEVQKAQEDQLRQAAEEAKRRAASAERERERVRLLEEVASTEKLVHVNQRWIAAVPFGVGQFQNGDVGLGSAFLTLEALAVTGVITGIAIELDAHAQAAGERRIVGEGVRDSAPFNTALIRGRELQKWSLGAFLFTAFVGLLEAEINFVPEEGAGERRRSLPEPLRPASTPSQTPGALSSLEPQMRWQAGAFSVGLSGAF